MSYFKVIWGLISDTVGRAVRLDAATHTMITLDTSHCEIHNGDSFSVADTISTDTETVKWQITTPNTTRYAHFIFMLSCTGEATFTVTEGSDRTDGTVLDTVNRRRVGVPTVATVTVTRTPTGGTTDGAITLFSMRSGLTNVASRNIETGIARAIDEWILKPNTKYIVSITTYSASYVTALLNWYEHTDKD